MSSQRKSNSPTSRRKETQSIRTREVDVIVEELLQHSKALVQASTLLGMSAAECAIRAIRQMEVEKRKRVVE